jgi:tripeptide aminopeptidase
MLPSRASASSAAEREGLARTFVALCEIESPSGAEAEAARFVRAELEALGLEVAEDSTGPETGAPCGNLFARIAGPPGARTIMLCAHLDTVPLADRVEVELVDGVYRNRGDGILGADNKAAVAVFLELARHFTANPPPVGLELLFTTCEEIGLRGAHAFDTSALEAEFGYVFDHASAIGELILAAPTYYQVTGEFTGRAAHSGLRPEAGRNAIVAAATAIGAMELGRVDEETTANVGVIQGGTATNVVAEHCRLEAEVRSLDDTKASDRMRALVDTLTWAASATETDVDTTVVEQFRAYRIPAGDPVVATAEAALRDCGVQPVPTATGGGSDANAFAAKGFRCLNLANGTEANHTPDERVSAWALETMLDVALRLPARAAETAEA